MLDELDRGNARICGEQRDFFRLLVRAERSRCWVEEGARDLAHLLQIRYGLSLWKAKRWVAAARALERLPAIAEAFASGELCVDKVVELTRFARPEDERRLIAWARRVSVAEVRNRADLEAGRARPEVRAAEECRSLEWWWSDDGYRFGLRAELPTADGAIVARALSRMAERVPVLPGEEDPYHTSARRADALVALARAQVASDPDPDRATVVVHVRAGSRARAELEWGPAIHRDTARRLACHARIQVVEEDAEGNVVSVGSLRREPPAWMVRLIRQRDKGCTFPGCGSRAFTVVHHIKWWSRGGRTTLANSTLQCVFHHKLLHELGWRVERTADGALHWSRPDGSPYPRGPAGAPERRPVLRPALRSAMGPGPPTGSG
ncbi:MAG TPA: DUF222 domain-containing protein [Actinomycetota bacterium]|nr:DUF222 domain-containing protein [Actinomycetota bacterium]